MVFEMFFADAGAAGGAAKNKQTAEIGGAQSKPMCRVVFPIVTTGAAVQTLHISAERVFEIPVPLEFLPVIKWFGRFNDRLGLLDFENV
jgi:hypothetical protein